MSIYDAVKAQEMGFAWVIIALTLMIWWAFKIVFFLDLKTERKKIKKKKNVNSIKNKNDY